jgi:hypothetical protein
VGYTDDQKGKDIRDEDVVRVSNGKWIAQHSTETGSWKEKSTGRCPTYGTCSFCFKAGPTGKKCVCTDGEYKSSFIDTTSSTPSRLPNYLRKNSKSPRLIACKTGS